MRLRDTRQWRRSQDAWNQGGARWVLVLVAGLLTTAGAILTSTSWASAADVVQVRGAGQIHVQNDPGVGAETGQPDPTAGPLKATRSTPGGVRRTVRSVLAELRRTGEIPALTYSADLGAFNAALAEVKHLPAARGVELEGVIENLHAMAVGGTLTAARLPVLFLTLDRNRQYWASHPVLSYGERVEFAGSKLVWEYYPGQGLQLQVLGSFGKADWLCRAGASYVARCQAMLAELIPLAVRRAGGLVWEYYFAFDGGVPPWTSAMSQATALQTLADAYKETGNAEYLRIAHAALPVLETPPPNGVGVHTSRGKRFVQYSFQPGRSDEIINAFLQTLIGLDDYAETSHDPLAEQLFAEGNAEAQAELPSFNLGSWSLYQPGVDDDLSYHKLVTGFLQQLCTMTKTPVYCTTASAFALDLKTPPKLTASTQRLRAGQTGQLEFSVSQPSRVGIAILQNRATVFLTSASFAEGEHAFTTPALKANGTYVVELEATDLTDHYVEISTPLTVTKK
jgi:hypothetical protein